MIKNIMYNVHVSETVLPSYINGQCPIIKTCSDVTLNLSSKDSIYIIMIIMSSYRYNSFIVDLRHKFTVRNINEIPVLVQSSELSNIT